MSRRRTGAAGHKALTRRTSLSFPAAISLDSWLAIGKELFILSDASGWWLGDWLVYGQERYPDRYRQAMEATSLHYKTLRNYAWVARKFEVSRRRDTLSLQHHAEVAALPQDEQDAWLDRAERSGWSVAELRRRMRAGRELPAERLPRRTEVVGFDLDPERRRVWQDAAERASSTLCEWISAVLDRETLAVLEAAREPVCEPVREPVKIAS